MKKLPPLSLSQLPYSLRTSRSTCLRLFTLSHIHIFADITPALSLPPSLPPSLLLALDSLSLWLSISLPTRTLHFSLALSIENSCVERGRYQEPYKLVFLYFLNTYLYSYVYFFIPL